MTPVNPVLVTASEVQSVLDWQDYDAAADLALHLSDPAIQTLIVRKVVEAMPSRTLGYLSTRLGVATSPTLSDAQRELLAALTPTRGPDHG